MLRQSLALLRKGRGHGTYEAVFLGPAQFSVLTPLLNSNREREKERESFYMQSRDGREGVSEDKQGLANC